MAAIRAQQYVLEEKIGGGAMGEVFLARREGAADFSRRVCVKVIHPHLLDRDDLVQLFLDEARTGANLDHSNILTIEDLVFDEVNRRYLMVMEYVNGADLRKLEQALRAAGEGIPSDAGLYIAHELLSALLYAHHHAVDRGTGAPLRVIHRDLCPHNTLVSHTGEVKLIDFGIARAFGTEHQTSMDVVRGRFGYMPPEQYDNPQQIDHRADLYALGVLLFELFSGTKPFGGRGDDSTMQSIIADQAQDGPDTLRLYRPDLPPAVSSLVTQMMRKDPLERPRDAGVALDVLQSLPHIARGRQTLADLMTRMFPSQASIAAVPRHMIPVPRAMPSAPQLPRVSAVPLPGKSRPPMDPNGRITARPRLELLPEEPSAPPRTLDPTVAPTDLRDSSNSNRSRVPRWVWGMVIVSVGMIAVSTGIRLRKAQQSHGERSVHLAASEPTSSHAVSAVAAPIPTNTAPSETPVSPAPVAESHPAVTSPPESAPNGAHVAHTTNTRAANVASTRSSPVGAPTQSTPATPPDPATPSPPNDTHAATPPSTRDPEPATDHAAAPAPSPGTLRVIAMPWGEVLVDGTPQGRSPVTMRIAPGEHTVRITGGVEHFERVVMSPGGTRVVFAEAPPSQ